MQLEGDTKAVNEFDQKELVGPIQLVQDETRQQKYGHAEAVSEVLVRGSVEQVHVGRQGKQPIPPWWLGAK